VSAPMNVASDGASTGELMAVVVVGFVVAVVVGHPAAGNCDGQAEGPEAQRQNGFHRETSCGGFAASESKLRTRV